MGRATWTAALLLAACNAPAPPAPVPSSRPGPSLVPSATDASSPRSTDAAGASIDAATLDAALVDVASADGGRSAAATGDAATDGGRDAPAGMRIVPGGTFVMGTDRGGEADERPAHPVRLASFWLDATEVTNAAYEACVTAKACHRADPYVAAHSHAAPESRFHHPRQPVAGVSWDDARAYCAWRGARLPREAEFERAVRGDDGRRYPWGDAEPTRELTCFGQMLESGVTDDAGAHPTGRGPYGHDDLAGNVWEWMEDEYDPLAYTRPSAPEGKPAPCTEIEATLARLRGEGRQGFTGSNPLPTTCEHVLRGGAYNYDAHGLRSTNRVHHPGNFRIVMAGFRCATDAR